MNEIDVLKKISSNLTDRGHPPGCFVVSWDVAQGYPRGPSFEAIAPLGVACFDPATLRLA